MRHCCYCCRLYGTVKQINTLEAGARALSDEQLQVCGISFWLVCQQLRLDNTILFHVSAVCYFTTCMAESTSPVLNRSFGNKPRPASMWRMMELFGVAWPSSFQAKTPGFKARIAAGESLDSLVPEAFAVVREASRRLLGMRHFDVQLVSVATGQVKFMSLQPR